jgi:hypothetical protein
MKAVRVLVGSKDIEIPVTFKKGTNDMTNLKWSDLLGQSGHPIQTQIEQNLACNCGEGPTDRSLTELLYRTGCEPTTL